MFFLQAEQLELKVLPPLQGPLQTLPLIMQAGQQDGVNNGDSSENPPLRPPHIDLAKDVQQDMFEEPDKLVCIIT